MILAFTKTEGLRKTPFFGIKGSGMQLDYARLEFLPTALRI